MSETTRVIRYDIIGTGRTIFAAYEPSSYFGPHGSLMTIGGKTMGEVRSRRIDARIDAIPVGPERWAACDAFRNANYEEAYAAIVAAHPEAEHGARSLGQIEMMRP